MNKEENQRKTLLEAANNGKEGKEAKNKRTNLLRKIKRMTERRK